MHFLFFYPARPKARGDGDGDGDFTIGSIGHAMSGCKAGEPRILAVAGNKRLIKQLGEHLNKMDGPDYEKVRMEQTEAYAALVTKPTGQ